MRIGLDARYVYPDHVHGIGRYSVELIRNLAVLCAEGERPRHELVVFRRASLGADLFAEERSSGYAIREIPVDAAPVSLGSLTDLGRVARDEDLDLWHALFPIVPPRPARRLVVTAHDLQALRVRGFHGRRPWPVGVAAAAFYRWTYASAFRRAGAIVAGSRWTLDDVVRTYGIEPGRIRVVPEGLASTFFEPPPDRCDVAARLGLCRGRYLLSVGNTRPQKNLPALLRGVREYLRRVPDPAARGWPEVLVLAGVRDRFYPEVRDLASRAGLLDRVRFPGVVPETELRALYAGAGLYLTAAEHEGFGFTPLEAMACGAPVVAARRGALPEVLGEAFHGFDPGSPSDLSCAIIDLLSDAGRRGELRRLGLERARRFRWGDTARRTLSVYDELASRDSPPSS